MHHLFMQVIRFTMFCMIIALIFNLLYPFFFYELILDDNSRYFGTTETFASWASFMNYLQLPLFLLTFLGFAYYFAYIAYCLSMLFFRESNIIEKANAGYPLITYVIWLFGFVLALSLIINGIQLEHPLWIGTNLSLTPIIIILVTLYFFKERKWKLFKPFTRPLISVLSLLLISGILYYIIWLWFLPFFEQLVNITATTDRVRDIEFLIEQDVLAPWLTFSLIFIGVGIIGPISEELLFRGALQERISQIAGIITGILTSALFFTILHGDIILAAPIFLAGIAFSLIYLYYKTLWAPIIVHMAMNIITVIFSYSFN